MNSMAPAGNRSDKRGAARVGRPPRELAGEVDERILEAAHRVFLERGLAGASVDEIAARAAAGKPTIYARFPNKEALYSAVLMRLVEGNIARFGPDTISGAGLEERLTNLARSLLTWVLEGDTVGLLRLAIAEARRFPDLANSVCGLARERGKEAVGRLLGEVARSEALGPLPAFDPERLRVTTQLFLDLTLLPMMLRALLGTKPEQLQAEMEQHVARSVSFFLAGCRYGWENKDRGSGDDGLSGTASTS